MAWREVGNNADVKQGKSSKYGGTYVSELHGLRERFITRLASVFGHTYEGSRLFEMVITHSRFSDLSRVSPSPSCSPGC